jgi:uncharacterized protein YqeY
MTLVEQIDQAVKEALKAGDQLTRQVLGTLKAALTNARIAKKVEKLADVDILAVIQREVKSRKDAAAEYRKGGAEDRAKSEEQEIAILAKYLPEQMSAEEIGVEIDAAIKEVKATTAKEIGKVMGVLSKKLRGKADLKEVNAILRKKLTA